jgi:hypothetical protein
LVGGCSRWGARAGWARPGRVGRVLGGRSGWWACPERPIWRCRPVHRGHRAPERRPSQTPGPPGPSMSSFAVRRAEKLDVDEVAFSRSRRRRASSTPPAGCRQRWRGPRRAGGIRHAQPLVGLRTIVPGVHEGEPVASGAASRRRSRIDGS